MAIPFLLHCKKSFSRCLGKMKYSDNYTFEKNFMKLHSMLDVRILVNLSLQSYKFRVRLKSSNSEINQSKYWVLSFKHTFCTPKYWVKFYDRGPIIFVPCIEFYLSLFRRKKCGRFGLAPATRAEYKRFTDDEERTNISMM